MLFSILLSLLPLTSAATTLIPSTCFNSYSSFEQYFGYLYPWGSDHNGSARMVGNSTDHEYISVNSGTLTLVAKPVSGQPPTSGGIQIHYLSGTVHAKQTFTVRAGSGFNIQAQFQAPVARGTWPAFWLTGANSWPPEIDIAEWKGTGKISFNTFNTSSQVRALDVPYPNSNAFHTIRSEIRDEDGANVSVKFYLDGQLITTQYGRDYIGKPLWLIIDLQMEGSSGSPGPTTDTYCRIRNLSVEQI